MGKKHCCGGQFVSLFAHDIIQSTNRGTLRTSVPVMQKISEILLCHKPMDVKNIQT